MDSPIEAIKPKNEGLDWKSRYIPHDFDWKEAGRVILIVLIVVAIGVTIANQYVSYFYKAQLLRDPCIVCIDRNPGVACSKEIKQIHSDQFINSIKVPDLNLTQS